MRIVTAFLCLPVCLPLSLHAAENPCGNIESVDDDRTDCWFELSDCASHCGLEAQIGSCDAQCGQGADPECTSSCSDTCVSACEDPESPFSCIDQCLTQCWASPPPDCDDDCLQAIDVSCYVDCEPQCDALAGAADCSTECEAVCAGVCENLSDRPCEMDCRVEMQPICEAACNSDDGALFCGGDFIADGDKQECLDYVDHKLPQTLPGRVDGDADGCSCRASEGDARPRAIGLSLLAALVFARRRLARRATSSAAAPS